MVFMAPSYVRADHLLTTAAFRGETERVRQMLAHGASASSSSELKGTALHWAVKKDSRGS